MRNYQSLNTNNVRLDILFLLFTQGFFMDSFQHKPDLWLLVLIVGLPQLSETVYTPALPDIARSLLTSHAMIEYTLTIYLFGFALGTLFWGKLSDKYGRKPALLMGLALYSAGCIGCFYSTTVVLLMGNRLLQAFGGSAGSVLGQAICRDAFDGAQRGKIFSIIGSALSFSPAFGPIIGGIVDQAFGWPFIFIFLIIMGLFVFISSLFYLPETYAPAPFSFLIIKQVFNKMIRDKRVLAYGFLVAACNGISFSYFAEGPFYLITMLGLSPSYYGFSFMLFACAGLVGGYASKKMHDYAISSEIIINKGITVLCAGALLFLMGTMLFYSMSVSAFYWIFLTLICMTMIMIGIGIMIPNILSLALHDYRGTLGTASSLFGFYYYCLISLFTLVMGLVHNGTLCAMPIYFFCIALSIMMTRRFLARYS